jgi:hypothetical protein
VRDETDLLAIAHTLDDGHARVHHEQARTRTPAYARTRTYAEGN